MKSLRLSLFALLLVSLQSLSAAPVITATQDDATVATTRKLVGDTITYTTTISNTAAIGAGNDAVGVMLTNPTPANTTDVGSVSISPIAFDDTYPQTVLPNIGINSANIPYSVVTNDFAGTPATTTIASFTQPSHGVVTMVTTAGANLGQFTYQPTGGYTGADSFTYTLTNAIGSSVGTVNLSVTSSPVIWFVNPNAASTGTGTLASPFKTLAEAITAIGTNTGQRIFLYTSGTAQSGNFILKANGWLVGQAAIGPDFDALMGIAPGSVARMRGLRSTTRPNRSSRTRPATRSRSGSQTTSSGWRSATLVAQASLPSSVPPLIRARSAMVRLSMSRSAARARVVALFPSPAAAASLIPMRRSRPQPDAPSSSGHAPAARSPSPARSAILAPAST